MIQKFNIFNNEHINEGFGSMINKLFVKNNWELLMIFNITSPYVYRKFGIAIDNGNINGYLKISVDRKNKKCKAIGYYNTIEKEYDINDIYYKIPNIKKIVIWSYTTDIHTPLNEIIYSKINKSFIKEDDVIKMLSLI